MEAGEKLAQTYIAVIICFMYNLGLPLLNILLCVFFFVAYWFNKYLLLRYYQKTYEFNEELPIYSSQFMKLGIMLHAVSSLLIFSNRRLFPGS